MLLLVLFTIQFLIPAESIRVVIAWIYLGLALLVLIVRRTSLRLLVHTGRECAAYYLGGRQSVNPLWPPARGREFEPRRSISLIGGASRPKPGGHLRHSFIHVLERCRDEAAGFPLSEV